MRVEIPLPSNGAVGDLMTSTSVYGCIGRICYFGPFAFIKSEFIKTELIRNGEVVSSNDEYRYEFDRDMRREIASELRKNQRRMAIFCSDRVFEAVRPIAEYVDQEDPNCERGIVATFYAVALIIVVMFSQWLDQVL